MDAERRYISGESGKGQLKYEAVSCVRSRVQEELTEDIAVLKENHPKLLVKIREVVCDEE